MQGPDVVPDVVPDDTNGVSKIDVPKVESINDVAIAAARSFERDVGDLRVDLNRMATLMSHESISVCMMGKRNVPEVQLRTGRAKEMQKDPNYLGILRPWHAAHPWCRVHFCVYDGDVWDAITPFPREHWHAAFETASREKRVAENAARRAKVKQERLARKAKVEKANRERAVRLEAGLPPVAPKPEPKSLRKPKADPDHCEHFMFLKNLHGPPVYLDVKADTSPTNCTIRLEVLTPGHERVRVFKKGDCVDSKQTGSFRHMTADTRISHITRKTVHFYIDGYLYYPNHPPKWKHLTVREFAREKLSVYPATLPNTSTAKRAVQSTADLDLLATNLVTDPTRIRTFLDALGAVPDHVVPSNAIFDALNAAHAKVAVTDVPLRKRIDALIVALSKPSPERMAALKAAAM